MGNQKQAVRLPQKAELIKIQYAAASAEAGVGYGGGEQKVSFLRYHGRSRLKGPDNMSFSSAICKVETESFHLQNLFECTVV